MCTVIVRVPEGAGEPVRLLAVRDEDPGRPWNPVGPWWPEDYPGVIGVRDERAGGAWLAADPAAGRLGVILNRQDLSERADDEVTSRGAIALEAAAGREPEAQPTTRAFNLVEVDGERVRVVLFDGLTRREEVLAPGTHMIAHDDVDDPATPRIARWRDAFRDAATRATAVGCSGDWFAPWLDVLDDSAALSPEDDEAIIRDNRPFGYPTLSLLLCAATITPEAVDVRYGEFARPGVWERDALAEVTGATLH